jgi:glycosyltransferase involved in cell wall biosynthesis
MISVVIPSLGGDLRKTIDSLNSGTIVPDEIVICLPNGTHEVDNIDLYQNVIVIYSKKYGQVLQRIAGFKKSKYNYILQLDDDILVGKFCLEAMLSVIQAKDNITVSPMWYNVKNKKPLAQKKQNSRLMSVYFRLINGRAGYVSGGVSLAGTNFGVYPDYVKIDTHCFKVDWQPGGCILHNRKNLILKNYYPFTGKAYSEDLIHSHLLRVSGITLCVVKTARCMTNPSPRLSMKELWADFIVRKHFVKIANLSVVRMYLHYIIYFINTIKGKN